MPGPDVGQSAARYLLAGGALERVSIRILLICWNPNKPHHGAARRTDWLFYRRSGKEIVVKGATGDLIR